MPTAAVTKAQQVMRTPCKLWTGAKNKRGYGVRRYRGKAHLVHRVAWIERHGEIPDGLCVLHHCDTPACYEDTHLFLGTRADNTADARSKKRLPVGERKPNHKLTALQVQQIRQTYVRRGHPNMYDLAEQFSVSYSLINHIINGRQRVSA